METPARERQAARRKRLRANGLRLFQAWVTEEQYVRLRGTLEGRPTVPPVLAPASPPPAVLEKADSAPARRPRKLTPKQAAKRRDALNREVIGRHREEIAARLAAGAKRDTITRWLESLGEGADFEGRATMFNSYWGPL